MDKMVDGQPAYDIVCADERMLEQTAVIFNTTNTTRLYPSSPHSPYLPGTLNVPQASLHVRQRYPDPGKGVAGDQNYARVQFHTNHWRPLTGGGWQAIVDDFKDNPPAPDSTTVGNFNHLRLHVDGSTYQVVGFGLNVFDINTFLPPDLLDQTLPELQALQLWVIASSSELTYNTAYGNAYLHMFSAPPSEATPLHIGGVSGIHWAQMLTNVYDGDYSNSDTLLPRYSTTATDTLKNEPGGLVRYRITGSARMGEWVENHLYRDYVAVPLLDSSGRIVPTSLRLPNSTGDIGFAFTASNLRDPHPTWNYTRSRAVTALQIKAITERGAIGHGAEVGSAPGDGIIAKASHSTITHDRVSRIGWHPLTLDNPGIHPTLGGEPYTLNQYAAHVKNEIFDRYGDGPVVGRFAALSTANGVKPGDWVSITLNTYPGSTARGLQRFVQILSKSVDPIGPTFEYLDGGHSLAQLTDPDIVLVNPPTRRKHEITARVGGVASRFELQIAASTGSIPASTSSLWAPWLTTASTSTGDYPVGRRQAGMQYWGRVRNTDVGRIRSNWSYTTTTGAVTSSGMTAPSAVAETDILAKQATLTWTLGESSYNVELMVDDSTSATLSTANRLELLPAGSKRYTLTGLSANSTYLWGVRHRDAFGGVSAIDSTTFETLTTASTANARNAPSMLAFSVLWGTTS
jgi:hypothetical protein